MANAPVEIFLPGLTGFTLALDLYPLGSDTLAATIAALTEATNRKGLYTGVTAAGLTGIHTAHARESTTVRGAGYVLMDDTTSIHRVVMHPALAKIDGAEVAVSISQVFGTALTEAYRATGATGTAAQLMYEILQNITEFAISGTTKTAKKLDGSTTAKTYTLDSATVPTSITETT